MKRSNVHMQYFCKKSIFFAKYNLFYMSWKMPMMKISQLRIENVRDTGKISHKASFSLLFSYPWIFTYTVCDRYIRLFSHSCYRFPFPHPVDKTRQSELYIILKTTFIAPLRRQNSIPSIFEWNIAYDSRNHFFTGKQTEKDNIFCSLVKNSMQKNMFLNFNKKIYMLCYRKHVISL